MLLLSRWIRLAKGLLVQALVLGLLPSCYVSRQAYHHLQLFTKRRLVADLLEDPLTPLPLKEKLKQVVQILAFAEKEGLQVAGSYRHYIATQGRAVSYLVQAAYADRLEPISWWFPILGSVPYLGFFDEQERDQEASRLKARGYDVYLSDVGAFSALGWLDDPLYSPMLAYPHTALASLLFHELTHRNFWLAGQGEFNEQLASFVEGYLSEKYFKAQGFEREWLVYQQKNSDKLLYKEWLTALERALVKLYASVNHKDSSAYQRMLEDKAQIFVSFTGQKRPSFQAVDYVGEEPWNNATVLAASLYSPDRERFFVAYKASRATSIGDFLQALKEAIHRWGDPITALDRCGRD